MTLPRGNLGGDMEKISLKPHDKSLPADHWADEVWSDNSSLEQEQLVSAVQLLKGLVDE